MLLCTDIRSIAGKYPDAIWTEGGVAHTEMTLGPFQDIWNCLIGDHYIKVILL
jgi:hypothetical protein